MVELLGLIARDDLTAVRTLAEDMLAGSNNENNDERLVGALLAYGAIAWDDGRVKDALGLLRAAVHRSYCQPVETCRAHPRLILAQMLVALGRHDDARAVIEQARGEIDRGPSVEWSPAPPACLARLEFAAGRLDTAERAAQTSILLARDLGTPFFVPFASATLAAVQLARGHTAASICTIASARSVTETSGIGFAADWYTWFASRAERSRHRNERAADLVAPICDAPEHHHRLLLDEPLAGAELVRIAIAAGESREATAVVSCLRRLAGQNATCRSVVAAADHARGLLDRDTAALHAASDAHVGIPARAVATEDLGATLYDHGDNRSGRATLERAVEMYERIGANGDAMRVRSYLANTRRTHRVAGGASTKLTNTERRLADFVGKGLTNRQIGERMFLSRHTIDFHLRRVYRKLGVSSRARLARLLLERPSLLEP
jgi:DNA-binding CsgD family transcriptional regulator